MTRECFDNDSGLTLGHINGNKCKIKIIVVPERDEGEKIVPLLGT